MPAQTVTADNVSGRTANADRVAARVVYGESFTIADVNPASLTSLVEYWSLNDDTRNLVGADVTFSNYVAGGLSMSNTSGGSWGGGLSEADPAKFGAGVIMAGDAIGNQSGSTRMSLAGDFTISLWVRMQASPGNYRCLISKAHFDTFFGPGGNCGWALLIQPASSTPRFFCSAVDITFTADVPDDSAYHHVLVRRSGSTFTCWIDGVQRGSATSAAAISYADAPGGTATSSFIGTNSQSSGFRKMDGYYDDIAVWDRAISDTEIANIYNGGTGRAIVAT